MSDDATALADGPIDPDRPSSPDARGESGRPSPNARGESGRPSPNARGESGRPSPNARGESGRPSPNARGESGRPSSPRSPAALAAELDLLAAENRRLRAAATAHRGRAYRRTGIGAALLGVLAAAGALAIPSSATVLFALAGVGLFTGLLTYYLTPERSLAAPVGERVYAAYARTGAELVADLGLADAAVFVPVDPGATDDVAPVRLFVPTRSAHEVPDADEVTRTFVVSDDDRRRGVSVVPTGAALLAEFERADAVTGLPLPDYADRVADALVDGFELVAAARAQVDVDDEAGAARATVAVRDSALGPVDRFDHPVASFVAAALARRLATPVTLEVRAADDGRADYLVTCRWTIDDADAPAADVDATA